MNTITHTSVCALMRPPSAEDCHQTDERTSESSNGNATPRTQVALAWGGCACGAPRCYSRSCSASPSSTSSPPSRSPSTSPSPTPTPPRAASSSSPPAPPPRRRRRRSSSTRAVTASTSTPSPPRARSAPTQRSSQVSPYKNCTVEKLSRCSFVSFFRSCLFRQIGSVPLFDAWMIRSDPILPHELSRHV